MQVVPILILSLIASGILLYIASIVLKNIQDNESENNEIEIAILWCEHLAYLFGVVSFLSILFCMCFRTKQPSQFTSPPTFETYE